MSNQSVTGHTGQNGNNRQVEFPTNQISKQSVTFTFTCTVSFSCKAFATNPMSKPSVTLKDLVLIIELSMFATNPMSKPSVTYVATTTKAFG